MNTRLFPAIARSGLVLLCLLTQLSMARKQIPPCQLQISSIPPGATVICDESVYDSTPLTLSSLATGEHLITLKKRGYNDAQLTINLEVSQKSAIDVPLETINALLLIHTKPQGANVVIDGSDRGQTPLLVTELPIGKHLIHLSLPGYIEKEIEINPSDRTPTLVQTELISESASLTLISDPPQAKVILNGIDKGTTPCTLQRILQGSYDLEIQLSGYKPFKRTLKLSSGQNETLSAALEPVLGKLSVVSIPPKARIYIDNQFSGETPITQQEITPGTHRIRAEITGYEILARTIELGNEENKVEEFRLERNAASIQITTEPAGVTITIDGKDAGITEKSTNDADSVSLPLSIDTLSPGKHKIMLSKKSYFSDDFSVNAEIGEAFTKHIKLKRQFIPNYEVQTGSETYKGMLVSIDPNGDVKLEIKAGIIKTIPSGQVKSSKPIVP